METTKNPTNSALAPPYEACDAGGCPANRVYRIVVDVVEDTDLVFCYHHYNKYELAFLTNDWTIEDMSGHLFQNKLKGSAN